MGVGIAVGTPVTRRPPPRSRRADFPHRALQPYSLPQSLAMPCREVSIAVSDPSRSVHVSCAGSIGLSAPFPCERRRIRAGPGSWYTTQQGTFVGVDGPQALAAECQ